MTPAQIKQAAKQLDLLLQDALARQDSLRLQVVRSANGKSARYRIELDSPPDQSYSHRSLATAAKTIRSWQHNDLPPRNASWDAEPLVMLLSIVESAGAECGLTGYFGRKMNTPVFTAWVSKDGSSGQAKGNNANEALAKALARAGI